ncbi:MAG: hypothetical protein U9N76_08225 [Candidatus Marinimicrobia bacterium]|nr:hypothetical protein [Candidatus Neomarinimicrobiota bacterium]
MTNKIFNKIKKLPEFKKDFKKLQKKYRTLESDLDIFIKTQLNLYHKLKLDNKGIFQISNLDITNPKIYKAKKFTSKSLKSKGAKSGIRIIYAYFEEQDIIEFIQIYYKGKNTTENRERIIDNYKS